MVPEETLPLLHVGDSVDLIVDSQAMELPGNVVSINAQGSVGNRTFAVRVELEDQAGKLLPGMGVSVFVPIMRESTELLVFATVFALLVIPLLFSLAMDTIEAVFGICRD
jgi:hypothetical protein